MTEGTKDRTYAEIAGGSGQALGTPDRVVDTNGAAFTSVSPGGSGSSGFTPGSVIFADPLGRLNQDNANFFFDDTNNRFHVGPRGGSPLTGTLNLYGQILFGPDNTHDVGSESQRPRNIYAHTVTTPVLANSGASLNIGTVTAHEVQIFVNNGAFSWAVPATGVFRPGSDNAQDLGTASLRPRDIYAGRQFLGADGVAANPSFAFASDPNTGFMWESTDTFTAVLGGVRRLQFSTTDFSPYTTNAMNLGGSSQVWRNLALGENIEFRAPTNAVQSLIVVTTGGLIIGSATTQKLGFWTANPVVQQVLATGAGATSDDIISLLQTLGLCRQAA